MQNHSETNVFLKELLIWIYAFQLFNTRNPEKLNQFYDIDLSVLECIPPSDVYMRQ